MNSTLRIIVFGVITWAIPFVIGMFLFPLQAHYQPLFETLMALSVCLAGCVMGLMLARKQVESVRNKGILIGMLWAAICIAIDLPIFTLILQMNLHHYMGDIGLIYLMLPLILWALSGTTRITRPVT